VHAPAPPRPTTAPYFPALDGLRGAAVLGVVAFHLDGWLTGGYLGVDLFFVLSGYLITGLLVAEQSRKGRIDLRDFWARRARRLLPAMLALFPAIGLYARYFVSTLGGAGGASGLVAIASDRARIRGDAFATLGYYTNWRAIFARTSYWDLFAAPSPLEHTWSLAIEEQFYVVWPLVFLAIVRFVNAKFRGLICLVGALASSLAMARLYDAEQTARVYFGTDTRIGAILLGAALAFLKASPASVEPPRVLLALRRTLFPAVALAVTALLWAKLPGQDRRLYRGGFLLAELSAVALIDAATLPGMTAITPLFSLPPLRWFGRLSYGIYLWHWPIFCVLTAARTHLGFYPLSALRLAGTLLFATASFHLLEEPIRREKWAFLQRKWAGLTAIAASYAVALGVVLVPTQPTQEPLRLVSYTERRAAELAPTGKSVAIDVLPRADRLPPKTARILTLGDSVSQRLGYAMRLAQDDFSGRPVFVADRGVGNCSIMENRNLTVGADGHVPPLGHPDPSHGCAANWVRDATLLKPDITVFIIGGAFFTEMTFHAPASDPRATDAAGEKVTTCDPRWQEAYRLRLDQLADEMGPSAGELVVARTPYPAGKWRWGDIPQRVDCFNGILDRFAAARHLRTIDLAGHLCPVQALGKPSAEGGEEPCRLREGEDDIRPDGLHPDGPGARPLAHWMLTQVVGLERP
jgi:peptidoglycan/LPS O-acetylase OafA/YrhL